MPILFLINAVTPAVSNIEKTSLTEIFTIIGVIFALLLAFLGWAYQLGFFSARVKRIEKDIDALFENDRTKAKEIADKLERSFDKVYKKLDDLPCHKPEFKGCL